MHGATTPDKSDGKTEKRESSADGKDDADKVRGSSAHTGLLSDLRHLRIILFNKASISNKRFKTQEKNSSFLKKISKKLLLI
jgi:hypothetical protein